MVLDMKTLSNVDLLIALLSYDPVSGAFHWKQRPREFFKTDGSHLSWNSRNACRQAGATAFSGTRDYLKITVLGTQYFAHRLAWIITHGSLEDDFVIDHINVGWVGQPDRKSARLHSHVKQPKQSDERIQLFWKERRNLVRQASKMVRKNW